MIAEIVTALRANWKVFLGIHVAANVARRLPRGIADCRPVHDAAGLRAGRNVPCGLSRHSRTFNQHSAAGPLPVTTAVAAIPLRLANALKGIARGCPVCRCGRTHPTLTAGFLLKTSFDNIDPGRSSEIIAHRGASFDVPENTLAAVEEAIRQGAEWVEVDVQETREGEIVVIHDSDLMKVGGSALTLWRATLSELQGVDIGSRFDAKFSAEREPTLQQLLETCRGRIGVNIELKYYGQEARFEERVVSIVEAMNMQDEVVAMSLNYAGVQKLRSLRPSWRVGLLSSVAIGDLTQKSGRSAMS